MKLRDIEAEIRLVAESMGLGETLRQVCPSCLGGNSSEHSLTITVFPNSVVKYNCFRNNCTRNVQGSFILAQSKSSRSDPENTTEFHERIFKPVRPRRAYFNGVTHPLTDFEKEWIWKAWGIKDPKWWYHTDQYGGRIAMSIRAPNYVHRGWVLRDIEGRSKSKALTYLDTDAIPLSWYRNRVLRGTLIVEDIPSAVRASKLINSVALLGTGAGLERASEIDRIAPRPIIIALDQDATAESFAMMERWGLLWGQVKVLPLKQDIKDLQERDLELLIDKVMT